MPTKPTPFPGTATLAQCRQLGATCLLGYPGGDWQAFDGALPLDVQKVSD